MRDQLRSTQRAFITSDDLHLVCVLTPVQSELFPYGSKKWEVLRCELRRLTAPQRRVAFERGVETEGHFLDAMASGELGERRDSREWRAHKHFWSALVLRSLSRDEGVR